MTPRCRLGSYAMTPRAYHRWGDALAVQRASTLEPNREADPGQSGHLSVRQAARIHPRGSSFLAGFANFGKPLADAEIHAAVPLCVHRSLEGEHVHALRSRARLLSCRLSRWAK